jgi:hypothetical protein
MRQRVSGRSGKPAGASQADRHRVSETQRRSVPIVRGEDLQRSTRPAIGAGVARAKNGTRPGEITAQPEEEEVLHPHEAVREHLARDGEERLCGFAGEGLVARVLGWNIANAFSTW